MIVPTHVLLVLVLLLAGTVEAGDEIGEDRWWHHINPPKSMLGTTGNELFLCDIGKPCKASYEAVGCYQRMREAMQAISPYIIDRSAPPSWPPQWFNDSEESRKNMNAVDLFDATMKDCVNMK